MNSDNSNNPAKKRRANDLEEELELVKGMLSRTKEDLEEQTSRSDGLEKLLAKYLEGFGSFEASNRLSTFVERHPEAIVTFELNESIIEWNPAAVKMFGWEKKEVIGRPFPLTDDKYRADFHTQLKSVLRGGQLTKHDMILQAKDGKLLNTRLSTTHLKNEQGKIIGVTGIIVDYTELRKKSDGAKRLATVVEQSPNMIMITNKDQIIEYVNQRWVEVTGYSQEEMIGKKASIFKTDKTPKETFSMIRKALKEDSTFQGELVNRKKNGEFYRVSCLISPLRDQDENVTHYASIQEDLTFISKLKKALTFRSNYDARTGLFNRQAFEHQVEELIDKAKKERTNHAVAFIDLDEFELVTANCGSKAGDLLLKQIGELLRSKVRNSDVVGRLGRDEYGIMLQYCTLQQAENLVESIRESVKSFVFEWEKHSYKVTLSVGLIQLNNQSEMIDTVMENVEFACSMAKKQGKNRIVKFAESSSELSKRHSELDWATKISRALENEQLYLVWQPILPVNGDDSLWHYEVLVRMHDEDGGTIEPGDFLSAAGKYEFLARIDRWVINKALSWISENKKFMKQIKFCSINLSGKSIGDLEIQQFILDTITSSNVPPSKLCFEITETTIMDNFDSVHQFFYALKNIGCQLAIDNFGTALSSFSYLKLLPVDYIKIDGTFIRNMVNDEIDRIFIGSVNDICHTLGKQTIATCVENEDILEELKKIEIDFVQGFAIGKTKPLEK